MNKYKTRILRNILSSVMAILLMILSFITLVNFSFYFLYVETNVRGYSMYPTINMNAPDSESPGDKILINRQQMGDVNDIVVAKASWYKNYIIKRLVGKPGDKIEIKDIGENFALYVNDEILYTKEKDGENTPFYKSGSYYYFDLYNQFLTKEEFKDFVESDGTTSYIKLDDDEYFLMGDNWGHTLDCLTNGPISSSEIVGKVDLIIDVNNNNPFVYFNFFMKKIFS